jgi:hypothetical protein
MKSGMELLARIVEIIIYKGVLNGELQCRNCERW